MNNLRQYKIDILIYIENLDGLPDAPAPNQAILDRNAARNWINNVFLKWLLLPLAMAVAREGSKIFGPLAFYEKPDHPMFQWRVSSSFKGGGWEKKYYNFTYDFVIYHHYRPFFPLFLTVGPQTYI